MTHFVASLGTCGTVSGAGRYLREQSGGKVQVVGVHPTAQHDIPGVRSLPQLHVTEHYRKGVADHLVEVTNEESYEMCLRLNQQDSIPCGPSSGMQVVGALRVIKDEPGVVAVVIFCDNIFKYTTSITKHCPQVFPDGVQDPESAEGRALKRISDAAADGEQTLRGAALTEYLARSPVVVDVRPREEYDARVRVAGAQHVSLDDILGDAKAGGAEPEAKRRRTLGAGVARVQDLAKERPVLLVCNRGIDSLTALLALRTAGVGTDVRHIGGGMFEYMALKEAHSLPTDGGAEMPAANDDAEVARLAALGYDREGKPKSDADECKT